MDDAAAVRRALKALPLTLHLSDEHQEALLPFSRIRAVRAGETIFCQGEPSPFCFGILQGEVAITRVTRDRRGPWKCLSLLGPGDLFGESALFDDSPRVAMANAHTDGELLQIQGKALRDWIKQVPGQGVPILLKLLENTLERLQITSEELSVVHGLGRLLGESRSFEEAFETSFHFLQNSLFGLHAAGLFERDAASLTFQPVPRRDGAGTLPLDFVPVSIAEATGRAVLLKARDRDLLAAQLPRPAEAWASVALVPLPDPDPDVHFLAGFFWVASHDANAFSQDMLHVLQSAAQPFREAFSRYRRSQSSC